MLRLSFLLVIFLVLALATLCASVTAVPDTALTKRFDKDDDDFWHRSRRRAADHRYAYNRANGIPNNLKNVATGAAKDAAAEVVARCIIECMKPVVEECWESTEDCRGNLCDTCGKAITRAGEGIASTSRSIGQAVTRGAARIPSRNEMLAIGRAPQVAPRNENQRVRRRRRRVPQAPRNEYQDLEQRVEALNLNQHNNDNAQAEWPALAYGNENNVEADTISVASDYPASMNSDYSIDYPYIAIMNPPEQLMERQGHDSPYEHAGSSEASSTCQCESRYSAH